MSELDAITCCPYCSTQFKVTVDQLAAASGKVRCGSCLQVFQGAEQMVHSTATEITGDDVATQVEAAPSLEQQPRIYEGVPETSVPYDDVDTWAAEADATLDALEIRETESDQPLVEYVEGPQEPDPESTPDPVYFQPAGGPTLGVYQLEDIQEGIHEETHEYISEAASEELDPEILEGMPASDSELVPEALLGTGEIALVAEEPQAIVGGVPQAAAASRLPWTLGALALSLVLFWQYAWYERNHWAQHEQIRGYYERVCALAGCQLPVYDNPARLRINELVVRTHPDQADALQIDAIILNSAAFDQVFPDLDLAFTDVNNKIVARRRFRPQDYLAGELQGAQHIPARTEVRIALEIVDPGEDAPGFALTLHGKS